MGVFKIVKLGLGEKVFELRAQGYSIDQISAQLKEQGYDVHRSNIYRFLKKYGDYWKDNMDPEAVEQYYIDANEQLFRINRVLWKQAEHAMSIGDTGALLRIFRILHNNIELFLKRQGEISEAPEVHVDINLISSQLKALVGFVYERHPELRRDFLEYVRSLKSSSEWGLKNAQQQ